MLIKMRLLLNSLFNILEMIIIKIFPAQRGQKISREHHQPTQLCGHYEPCSAHTYFTLIVTWVQQI